MLMETDDREEYCGENAQNMPNQWRKNLRDNTVTGVTPLPDSDEEVDEGWMALTPTNHFEEGATENWVHCPRSTMLVRTDVYNGPVDDTDNDGDGQVNEDHVDGNDDD